MGRRRRRRRKGGSDDGGGDFDVDAQDLDIFIILTNFLVFRAYELPNILVALYCKWTPHIQDADANSSENCLTNIK